MELTGEHGASWNLANILEVDDDQYEPLVRIAHLNQACVLLARRYETRLIQHIDDLNITAGTKSFLVSRLNTAAKTADVVIGNLWFNPAGDNSPVIGGDLVELLNEFGDSEGAVLQG